MEAITVIGSYDHKKGGHIVFCDDNEMIEMPVGATVLFPAGTKRYFFAAVGKGEHQYLFKQFCNAGALRWVEKNRRTDLEFANDAPLEEFVAWEEMCFKRGETSAKLFTKIRDVFFI
ncbi:hypothetical protein B0H19DRAFT_945973 [Mycena capillaripes]|nr:hypothetical protein B0H19DRAFT_945973 [Mycena capillaripes]